MNPVRRSHVVLLAFLLLGIVAVLWIQSRKPDPVKEEVSQVLKSLYQGNAMSNVVLHREDDIKKLKAAGTNAIEQLLGVIEGNRGVETVERLSQKQTLIPLPFDDSQEKKSQAVEAFKILGPEARSAAPRLMELIKSGKNPEAAAKSLAALGPDSVLLLAQELTNSSPAVRQGVASALYESTYYFKPAFEEILKVCEDPEDNVRMMGILLLGQAYFEDPIRVWELLRKRAGREEKGLLGTVLFTMTGIAERHPERKEEVMELVESLKDHPDPILQSQIKSTLTRFNGGFSPSMGMFGPCLAMLDLVNFHISKEHKLKILKELSKQGKHVRYAAPIVRLALEEPDEIVREEAKKTLAIIDPEDRTLDEVPTPHPMMLTVFFNGLRDMVAIMEKNSTHSDAWASQAWVVSLWGSHATNAIPELERGLQSDDPVRKKAASFALRYILGPY